MTFADVLDVLWRIGVLLLGVCLIGAVLVISTPPGPFHGSEKPTGRRPVQPPLPPPEPPKRPHRCCPNCKERL